MSSSPIEIQTVAAIAVQVSDDSLTVDLVDGRTMSVPLAWFPRLTHASETERQDWEFIGHGEGIHWPQIDEDINVQGLLLGRPSGESPESLRRWLASRAAG